MWTTEKTWISSLVLPEAKLIFFLKVLHFLTDNLFFTVFKKFFETTDQATHITELPWP